MNKPESLRAHLLSHVPDLMQNPDRLLIFIDSGRVRCTAAASLSFEYGYQLQIILTDFAGHPDTLMLPLLQWVSLNQSELLANLEKSAEGITFEADMIDQSKVDLSITLPLTERVVVKQRADGTHSTHRPPEPQYNAYDQPLGGRA
ncbi:phage tail protein [Pseudomonas viridiflava]|uniref:phage tail protein n=1 Tax=Pseudomonas viridiflava TaxID=33069 RepID=UPI001F60A37D|nr:phage tail protein [Pseudomonas viridiflava]MCI3908852.1 phage tail protein [Pseudomonas viridiflava]